MIRNYYFVIVSPISKEALEWKIHGGWGYLGNYDCVLGLFLYTTLGTSALNQIAG